jgi:hypothetical protein
MAGRSQMLRLPAYQAMTKTARIASSGFIPPCLPTKVDRPPTGKLWVHEIKRDRYGTRAPHLKESLSCH